MSRIILTRRREIFTKPYFFSIFKLAVTAIPTLFFEPKVQFPLGFFKKHVKKADI